MASPNIAKVLVAELIHDSGIELLKKSRGLETDYRPELTEDELLKIVSNYDGLIVGSRTAVPKSVLERAPRLKALGVAGAGLDNIDVPGATARGVAVLAPVGLNAVSAAEHTIALMMSASRRIPFADASMKAGKWEKKKFQGAELAGKTVGILGLGQVGIMVSRKASQGLKMNVIGYDAVISRESAQQAGVKLVTIEEMLEGSDIVTAHIPLTEGSKGLFNSRTFGLMKKGAILVNTSDLGIVDVPALIEALDSGRISCAAVDVSKRRLDMVSPLLNNSRAVVTPDLSAQTGEAEENFSISAARNMIDFFEKGTLSNAINVPNIDPGQRVVMGPYLDLSRRLGQFLGGLASDSISRLEVQLCGEISDVDVEPITNAGLWGLLGIVEGAHVNYVNAPVAARDRGIRVLQTTQRSEQQFGSSVRMTLTSVSGHQIGVEGALIQRIGNEPRIIGIDSFITEAVPSGPMLLIKNMDIPGMIAGVSGALAKSGANIAQMNLSRDMAGGTALSILNLDSPADEQTLDTIRSIKGILGVTQLILDA